MKNSPNFNGKGFGENIQDFEKYLTKKTFFRLGQMLALLKEGDSKETRNKLRSHCQYLSKLGVKANLHGWIELLETASIAIVDANNNYEITTKLIIKEIKEANEKISSRKGHLITVSNQLRTLVPESYIRLMDLENMCEQIESPKPEKHNLNKDLWKDTEEVLDLKNDKEITMHNEELNEKINEYNSLSKSMNNQDIIDDINNQKNDLNILSESVDDWLNQDYFEDEDNESTAIFLNRKDYITETNNSDSFDEISLLFDENSEDNKLKNREADNNIFTEENWDLLSDLPQNNNDGEIQSSEEDIFDLLDDLQSDLEINQQNNITLETIQTGEDLLTSQMEIDAILKSTLELNNDGQIYSDSQRELKLENWQNSLIMYENFEDLDNFIESDYLPEIELETLNLLEEPVILYYEDFGELEYLINAKINENKLIDWEELNSLIEGKVSEKIQTAKIVKDVVVEKSNIRQEELSDIDKLIAQAQFSSNDRKRQEKDKKNQTTSISNKKKPFEQSMRVPVKQLDNLNNMIGEMVIRRNRLEEDQERLRQFLDNLLSHVQNLSDVGARTQDLYERSLLEGALFASRERNQATAKAQLERSEPPQNTTPELDVLELDRFSRFHVLSQEIIELIVRVRESTSDIQFLVDETEQLGRNLRQITNQLQEEINKSRMVAFSQTAERLPRAVRDISYEYNKDIELKVEGKEVLIDKMILEHLWDPIQQLVKNSITHGIEVPEIRKARGKSPTGTITIRTFLQGPQTVIAVSDDGGGIDSQKVKQKAIEKKLITPAQGKNISNQEMYEFLFYPGFSTFDKADSHAGRGVGLDIVRSKLNEIRGTVSIDSTLGIGTTFTIRLPLTLSIGKALCCLNDNARIAFPMDGIEDTKDYSVKQIEINDQGQKCIRWRNTLLPFRSLSNLLSYNRQITRSIVYGSKLDDDTVSIVILRGGNTLLAIEVDQVLGQEEIVIKQISGPLPKPKGIAGATVRSDGIVMPIGDVIELIGIARGDISTGQPKHIVDIDIQGKSQQLVMIVDDSITIREMLSLTFTKAGYRVEQSRDGQEAWQKLCSGLPCDLVICDIEMPRMNGLELLKHMQEDEKLSEIPLAILSSRGAEKHQKIAAELGASAYLIKPYVEKDLLNSVTRMIEGEVLLQDSTKKPKEKPIEKIELSTPENTPQVKPQRQKSPMVLIIDDSVVVREMLSMTFKKAGYQVEQARDGQDAWDQLLADLPCDVVLCDIEMPRMNGLELLARMQQDEHLSSIPVAMVTSRGAEKHRKIAADLGAKAYFTKPYLEDELLQATQRLIKGEVLLKVANS